jgi:hypothetical protein
VLIKKYDLKCTAQTQAQMHAMLHGALLNPVARSIVGAALGVRSRRSDSHRHVRGLGGSKREQWLLLRGGGRGKLESFGPDRS